MFFLEKFSTWARPTQGKLENRKQMQNQKKNLDYINVLGWSHPKETTTTTKERQNLLMEVKAESYYGFRTMAKKI